jgi:hypothetical protein
MNILDYICDETFSRLGSDKNMILADALACLGMKFDIRYDTSEGQARTGIYAFNVGPSSMTLKSSTFKMVRRLAGISPLPIESRQGIRKQLENVDHELIYDDEASGLLKRISNDQGQDKIMQFLNEMFDGADSRGAALISRETSNISMPKLGMVILTTPSGFSSRITNELTNGGLLFRCIFSTPTGRDRTENDIVDFVCSKHPFELSSMTSYTFISKMQRRERALMDRIFLVEFKEDLVRFVSKKLGLPFSKDDDDEKISYRARMLTIVLRCISVVATCRFLDEHEHDIDTACSRTGSGEPSDVFTVSTKQEDFERVHGLLISSMREIDWFVQQTEDPILNSVLNYLRNKQEKKQLPVRHETVLKSTKHGADKIHLAYKTIEERNEFFVTRVDGELHVCDRDKSRCKKCKKACEIRAVEFDDGYVSFADVIAEPEEEES